MYREGILVCLKENIFWSVPEITGSMAGHEPVRECGLLAINDTCVIKWFGSFGHNEWCFIVIICWANIHSYPRTCRNTYPARKTVFWFAWKRTYFCWCLKLQEAWRAGHEPVRECGLAIYDTALLNGFGHNEWCFIVNNLLGQYSLRRECILVGGWKRSEIKVNKHGLLDMNLKYQIVLDTVNLAKNFRLKYY